MGIEKVVLQIKRGDSLQNYLFLLRPIFRLTDLEVKIIIELIRKKREIQSSNIAITLLDSFVKKQIAKNLGIKDNLFSNYIKQLIDKKAIVNNDLHPTLYPPKNLRYLAFVFNEDLE